MLMMPSGIEFSLSCLFLVTIVEFFLTILSRCCLDKLDLQSLLFSENSINVRSMDRFHSNVSLCLLQIHFSDYCTSSQIQRCFSVRLGESSIAGQI